MSLLHIICFILLQMLFLNVTESEFTLPYTNKSYHSSSWKDRSKRSLFDEMQSQLKITLKYGTEEEVALIFKKVPQYLANEHLPVIRSLNHLNPNIMNEVGEFVLYHDVSKCAAVVYFKRINVLFGMIGMYHHIQDLPFDFDENGVYRSGVVGEPYVKIHEFPFAHIHPNNAYHSRFDMEAMRDFLRPSSSNSHFNYERQSHSDAGPSAKRQRIEQNSPDEEYLPLTNMAISQNRAHQHYYLEIVVFVASDIVELFKSVFQDLHIRWIVRHLIIYFNAVDMVFQQTEVTSAKIHINIAKIVIESDSMPFSFINNGQLKFTDIVRRSRRYLQFHKNKYSPDSFDHIFIYTSRGIFDENTQVNAITKYGANLYEARKRNEFYNAISISVVRLRMHSVDYVFTVHEIGRVLNMNVDPQENGLQLMGQCYGIMQREGPKCENCLKWSDESRNRLGDFLRTNLNRCFLLNEPRSLRPPGTSIFLRAATQCECFGYHSHEKYSTGSMINLVGIDGCRKPLQCQIGCGAGSNHEATVIPFDGTPCAKNMACWNRKCRDIRHTRIITIKHEENSI